MTAGEPGETQEFNPFADEDGEESDQPDAADQSTPDPPDPAPGTKDNGATRSGPNIDPTPTTLIPRVTSPHRDWVDHLDHWFPERYRLPCIVTTAVSLALSLAFLFLPLAGTDLSAQVARGHFFQAHGWHTVDFRWYGGVFPFGYSVLSGPLNAAMGSRGVGAVSCVLAAVGFAWLLARYGVRRPLVGGVLAAVVGVFNLVSGRTTFALGIAIGMFALVGASLPRVSVRWRMAVGGLLAMLSVAGSPIAGLFVGLVGGAVILANVTRGDGKGRWFRPARWLGGPWREGLALCVGALVGVLPTVVLFPDGGRQPFTSDSMKVFLAVCVATFFLLPRRYRALRIGAVLTVVLILFAFVVQSPIGSNAARLPVLYSAPLVAAVSTIDRRLLAGAIVALTWWQPPLVTGDLGNAGDRTAQSAFYQPLIDELSSHEPIGRIEVVPLYDHWESTYVAEAVPLARGWERQVDVKRNRLFYNNTLAPDTYVTWLYHNAVSYVAMPRHAKLDKTGGAPQEAALIEAGLPYLRQTWHNADWTLYQVIGGNEPGSGMVTGVGVLVDSGPTGVTFDTTSTGRLSVRVRWSHWLTLSGPDACFGPDPDGWVSVRVNRPGRYVLSSAWQVTQPRQC